MTGVYFTITGMNHYQGSDFLKRGMEVELIKEPENHYDMFAIRVEVYGRGKIGYVANTRIPCSRIRWRLVKSII